MKNLKLLLAMIFSCSILAFSKEQEKTGQLVEIQKDLDTAKLMIEFIYFNVKIDTARGNKNENPRYIQNWGEGRGQHKVKP